MEQPRGRQTVVRDGDERKPEKVKRKGEHQREDPRVSQERDYYYKYDYGQDEYYYDYDHYYSDRYSRYNPQNYSLRYGPHYHYHFDSPNFDPNLYPRTHKDSDSRYFDYDTRF
jgi:hypothetical protein